MSGSSKEKLSQALPWLFSCWWQMKLTLEQQLAHSGHPVLRWYLDNIFIKTDPAGNIKPDKDRDNESAYLFRGFHQFYSELFMFLLGIRGYL
ncbi:MAG: hypothetical protein EOM08_04715 [Clostridia bacterium]|nr:hypothetical protein [Clostridia bacterium]